VSANNGISITRKSLLRDALGMLDSAGSGILLLVDESGRFERTVTDGDLRRIVLNGTTLDDDVGQLPVINSLVATEYTSRREALRLMDERGVNHLPLIDGAGNVMRVLHRRDIDKQILLSTPHMGSSELEFVEEAFRTNWIAPLGPNVDAFERKLPP
jgi:CBS domain-containing protein